MVVTVVAFVDVESPVLKDWEAEVEWMMVPPGKLAAAAISDA